MSAIVESDILEFLTDSSFSRISFD